MEKSEKVSKLYPASAQLSGAAPKHELLPFSGLGFDFGAFPSAGAITRVAEPEPGDFARTRPNLDIPLPSGRRLQISLGREIRGR
jgi:hypothetical protein